MAGSIKGIIVEIGGDTSGLQKALSKVNSASSSLSKELRGINSLLKLDPKNTELVAQKQEVLSKSIETTKDKLNQLKDIQSKAIEEGIDKNEEQQENWRALQREIINTQNKLNRFLLEQSGWTIKGREIEEYGKKLENVGSKLDNLGSKLTTRLSLPIVALGTLGTKSAMEQEASIQQVEKIYGEASNTIKDFANNTALSYNMSTKSAYKYSQIFGNLIQSMTDDQAKNAQYTQDLLKASSVIASATGRTMEDVMDRIRSGLLGNTEAIEDLGVNVNVSLLESTEAFRKFAGDKSWNQLDFQTQQQIRLFGILEQTTKKYGEEVNVNTTSKVQKLTAKLENLGSKLSSKLLPIVDDWLDKADEWLDKLDDLDEGTLDNIVSIGLFVAAFGPAIKIVGKLTGAVGTGIKGLGKFSQAIAVVKSGAESSDKSVNILAKGIKGLISPAGLTSAALVASFAAISYAVKKSEEDTKEAFENMGNGANNFINGIDSATSHLDSFNSTLFASNEEQQRLQNNMNEVQQGITEICQTASNERRGYTEEEIKQLDEYFTKLKDLKNKELEIQQNISNAIVQQASQNAETFQGSLEEYKVQSQEWIKTAQEQKDKELEIINDRTTQEIALLQQRYGDKATLENAEYKREYDAIMLDKDNAINQANDKVAKVNEIYSQGYIERMQQDKDFYSKIEELNIKIESENQRHSNRLEEIMNSSSLSTREKQKLSETENSIHSATLGKIWDDTSKNMSNAQQEQMGTWLGLLSQTELYGGQIDEKTKEIANNIISSFDNMPSGTRKVMQDTMQPMLEEMEKSEPSLFAKATSIANGILNNLRHAFDIHSPSRKTRKIFEYVMEGGELAIDKGAKKMYSQVNSLSNNLLNKFKEIPMDFNLGNINKKVMHSNNNVFTTPQIIFNVNELDEKKLQQCFNYINRKFGSAY